MSGNLFAHNLCKSMKKIICLALLAGMFLFANSCQENEICKEGDLDLKSAEIRKEGIIDEVKSWFECNPEINSFELLKWREEIKWSKAKIMIIQDSVFVEVPIKLKDQYQVMDEKDIAINVEHRLLFKKENGFIESYIEYIISKRDLKHIQDAEQVNYSKKDEHFDGAIILQDSKKGIKIIYQLETPDDCEQSQLKSAILDGGKCYGLYEHFSDGSSQLIVILFCTSSGSGGGGGVPGSYPNPNPTLPCNCVEFCHVCGGCLQMLKSAIADPEDGEGGTTVTVVCDMCMGHPMPDPNLPCAGDPIKNTTIASSGASGQYGGTYGCVRQGGTTCNDGIYNKKHGGLDVYAQENSDLYSISSGKVSYVGYIADLGNCIQVTNSDNSTSILYAHLNSQCLAVGNDVKIGDKLGLTGKTGNASDPAIIPHVHIQIKVNGVATDPQPFLSTTFNSDGSVSVPCNN